MSRDSGEQSDASLNPSSEASGQEPGLLEMARMLEHELRGVVHDHISLAALKTRHAGENLVRILAMGVIAVSLVFTAWLRRVCVCRMDASTRQRGGPGLQAASKAIHWL